MIQTEAARACSAVLLSIDDTDPMVLPPLWEAVLHILSCVDVRLIIFLHRYNTNTLLFNSLGLKVEQQISMIVIILKIRLYHHKKYILI